MGAPTSPLCRLPCAKDETAYGPRTSTPRGVVARREADDRSHNPHDHFVLDLLELDQIGVTGDGIFVDAVEMRFIPEARPLQFRRPPRSARVQINDCFDEGGPVCAAKADVIVSIMSQLG